jgi:hypothetical protein
MHPNVHHLCRVSKKQVDGTAIESATSTGIVDITERGDRLAWGPSPRYGGENEDVRLNILLGTQNPATGSHKVRLAAFQICLKIR